VVLLISLLALVILMIGAVALVRSMDTSSLVAGNLAFRRDLTNHGERGIARALQLLRSGALANETSRQTASPANNYSPAVWASDARGIPNVLLDDDAFAAAGLTGADIVDADAGVTIRYVIDRQCEAGTTVFDATRCIAQATKGDPGGTAHLAQKKPGGELRPVFRISVRVTGPRGTQSFLQSTAVL
jgi:hypothetical protein